MKTLKFGLGFLLCGFFIMTVSSCNNESNRDNKILNEERMNKESNPAVYFEIPAVDIERAIKFYSNVFNFSFDKQVIDNNQMALFPFSDENYGISGALAKGQIYKPTKDGVVIYFWTRDIDKTLQLAIENGGQILYPKTSNGELGFVAEFEDSEGNRIALHQQLTDN